MPERAAQLKLLQEAVAARIHAWDAERILERAILVSEQELPDPAIQYLDSLALNLNKAGDVFTRITEEHMDILLELAKLEEKP